MVVQLGEIIKTDLKPNCVSKFFKWCKGEPQFYSTQLNSQKFREDYLDKFARAQNKRIDVQTKRQIRTEFLIKPIAEALQLKMPASIDADYVDFGSNEGQRFVETLSCLVEQLESNLNELDIENELQDNKENFIDCLSCALNEHAAKDCYLSSISSWYISRKVISPRIIESRKDKNLEPAIGFEPTTY